MSAGDGLKQLIRDCLQQPRTFAGKWLDEWIRGHFPIRRTFTNNNRRSTASQRRGNSKPRSQGPKASLYKKAQDLYSKNSTPWGHSGKSLSPSLPSSPAKKSTFRFNLKNSMSAREDGCPRIGRNRGGSREDLRLGRLGNDIQYRADDRPSRALLEHHLHRTDT